MKIEEVDINKIKPDPNQPRTSIDEADLREMAQSIVTQGVINAIEVDKDSVIITGERRWRASKIAGLKTVPVKVLTIGKDERYMRQVIENIHHNTMSDWDTANALRKLVDEYLFHGVKQIKTKRGRPDVGIRWLHDKTGKSLGYIAEKLTILDASDVIKKGIKEGKISATMYRAIMRTPEKYRAAVEKKILDKELVLTEGPLALAFALRRGEQNPATAQKLLDVDYSQYKTEYAVKEAIQKISPTTTALIAKTYALSKEISKIADALRDWIRDNPKTGIGQVHAPRVIINMNFIKTAVEQWFAD